MAHLIRYLLLSAPLLLVPLPGRSQEKPYCAFEVSLRSPSGDRLSNMPVALVDKNMRTLFATSTDLRGIARICDSPFDTVNIVVGVDICGSVLVRNLRPVWPDTNVVFVTYEDKPCDHF